MEQSYRKGSHVVYDVKYHLIWVTKYRYKVLNGKIAKRVRELIIQGCEIRGVKIIEGSVGKDHIHVLISCPPNISPNKLVQYLKGRTSKLLQEEFVELRKRYWGQHLWAIGYYCGTVGKVDEEVIREYIRNQEVPKDKVKDFKIE